MPLLMGKVQLFVEKHHMDTMLANMAVHIFNDNAMMQFRKIKVGDSPSKQ